MSNDTAHVDPIALHEFAVNLNRLADAVGEIEANLGQRLDVLGETFRDEDYRDFREHFRRRQQYLQSFVEQVREHTPKLRRDAETIASTQQIKLPA
jgi:methyl-accepting chemotaxis protein